jgi:hypothetical protein
MINTTVIHLAVTSPAIPLATDWGRVTAWATVALAVISGVVLIPTAIGVWVTYRAAKDDLKVTRETLQVTRDAADAAKRDAEREIGLLQQQLEAEHRPLLIEVVASGPIFADMGAHPNPKIVPNRRADHPPTIEVKFGQREGHEIDPRSAYVGIEGGTAYVSVPLRNVGRGLAVIDPNSIDIHGIALGAASYAVVHRERVPVGETTRIDVAAHCQVGIPIERAEDWCIDLRYGDFAREQLTQAKIQLRCPEGPQGPWYVVDVDQKSI